MDLDARLAEGMKAQQTGDVQTAFSAYAQVLQQNQDHPDGLHYMGLLVFREDKPENAIALIERSLEVNDLNASAHANLGMMFSKTGRPDDALDQYIRAIEIDPTQADIWKKLGVLTTGSTLAPGVLYKLSMLAEQNSDRWEAWLIFGGALWKADRLEEAGDALNKGLELGAGNGKDAARAVRLLHETGRSDCALKHLEALKKKYPEDIDIDFQLSSLRGDNLAQVPEDYVKSHFDRFAESFDDVLERLGYDTPHEIAAEIKALADSCGRRFTDAVDLGCGTGLCGPLVREYCDTLSGMDLSGGMLEKASARKCYDHLIEGEIIAFLNSNLPTQFELAICADTLCYIGDLTPFFQGLNKALKCDGLLVASVELMAEGETASYRLHPSGRYAHTFDHVESAVVGSGLVLGPSRTETLRKEFGKEVKGLIFQVSKT